MKSLIRNVLLAGAGLVVLSLPADAAGTTTTSDLMKMAQRNENPGGAGFRNENPGGAGFRNENPGGAGVKKPKKKKATK
jgi:hypothetical protein